MQIETVAVDRLVPYARNSRTHSADQVAQIAASITEFGFTNPVLIDMGGGIIAGHGRVMAAKRLGMSEVPCLRLGHLSEAQRRAYVIADNKLALNAGWDEEALALDLRDLADMGYDIGLTGFLNDEIDHLLSSLETSEPKTSNPVAPINLNCPSFSVVITARDEKHQAVLLDEFEKRGLPCRALML